MLILTLRDLFAEKTRLALSVGGVALAVLLITALLALFRGWDEHVGTFVNESDVDIWIGSDGARDLLGASSLLPVEGRDVERAQRYLETHNSVNAWSTLIVRPTDGARVDRTESGAEQLGPRIDILFIGFDPATGLGGPIRVTEGSDSPGIGEMIVDSALADRYGISLGDRIRAAGRDWSVAGKSDGGDFVGTQTAFVRHDQAQEALQMSGSTTFYVLSLADGADASEALREIEERAPQTVAYTREQFAENTRDRVLGDVIPLLVVVLVLAFVVGFAVAGLTVYTTIIQKSREFGILKAVGFDNAYLYRLVIEQSLVTSIMGFGLGATMTILVAPFLHDLVPQFVVLFRWQDLAGVLAGTVVMATLAAILPVRRVASIDPVSVFSG